MIDTHCHLADAAFSPDLAAVLQRAATAGVDTVIAIADSLEESASVTALAASHARMLCSVGVHPHHADLWPEDGVELLRTLAAHPRVCAIGEIGLDYHYDRSPRPQQRAVFRAQLSLARELRLPAILHNRDSLDDLLQIIQEIQPPQLVLHCCTEPYERVRMLVERGYFLSFTGIATFPNAEEVRATIRQCPLEQLLLETDAPYLAPLPHRGERNEPAFIQHTAQLVATLKGVSLQELDRVTSANARRLFRLP